MRHVYRVADADVVADGEELLLLLLVVPPPLVPPLVVLRRLKYSDTLRLTRLTAFTPTHSRKQSQEGGQRKQGGVLLRLASCAGRREESENVRWRDPRGALLRTKTQPPRSH